MQIKTIIAGLLVITLASCAGNTSDTEQGSSSASMNDYLARADSASFSSDLTGLKSPSRKYIRTADMKCRVNDVFQVTTELERLVSSLGGIIEQSDIKNVLGHTKSVYHNVDSVRQIQTYTTTATLTLRLPVTNMDSVVKVIPELSAFVDKRTLSQADVTLNYISNVLKNKNAEAAGRPGTLAKKTQEAIDAQEYEEQKKDAQIDRRMENLRLLEQVNSATITVSLYQPQRVNQVVVVDPERIAQVPFRLRLLASMHTGVHMILNIFFFFLQFWTLWLVIIGGWLFYRKILKSRLSGMRGW